jgi:TPP-dependent pyruvate/acetoin dehydrogenase alpha subunit
MLIADRPDTAATIEADTELQLEMLRWMVLSREIEDQLHRLHVRGRLRGRLISGRGQEAIPVGATMALADGDVVAPVHRDLGAHLVRGTTSRTILQHYFGAAAGPSGGRDGDIHMGEWAKGVFPMVSHLPDSWPVLCGLALGARLEGSRRVALAFCGDGATSTGAWHESVNFAAVFDLPVVLVVENNGYAYSTPTSRQYTVKSLAERGAAYGIPGVQVDGNDCEAVHAAASEAVALARAGGGPTLIEAVTFRIDGHAVHDGAPYVPAGLRDEWLAKDPIDRLRGRLLDRGVPGAALDRVRAACVAEVANAIEQAATDPAPHPATLTQGVYADAAP